MSVRTFGLSLAVLCLTGCAVSIKTPSVSKGLGGYVQAMGKLGIGKKPDIDVDQLARTVVDYMKEKGSKGEFERVVDSKADDVTAEKVHLHIETKVNNKTRPCLVSVIYTKSLNLTDVLAWVCNATQAMINQPDIYNDLEEFDKFIRHFDKNYATEDEYMKKFRNFQTNLARIGLLASTDEQTGRYGLTKFSDLSDLDFASSLGIVNPDEEAFSTKIVDADVPDVTLDDELDYRKLNVVSPVRDQKDCAASWAISIIGAAESTLAIQENQGAQSLSVQELLDCGDKVMGCNGGNQPKAIKNLVSNMYGVGLESYKPYRAVKNTCGHSGSYDVIRVHGGMRLPRSEDDIARYLTKYGPVSVGINADPLRFYTGGVAHPNEALCHRTNINHAVLIVGYGVEESSSPKKSVPYWIVKNSWGTDWGEDGYFRLHRGFGVCGIEESAYALNMTKKYKW